MPTLIRFAMALFIFCVTTLTPVWAANKSASPANCTYSVVNGWTQTISYQCDTAINLNGATIQFTVDNPNGLLDLNNVWGFINLPRYPLNPSFSLSGNTVTLPLNFQISNVTLPANTTSNFSYSTGNNVKVTSFALYPVGSTSTTGTLTFSKNTGSDTLPADTSIRVSGVDTPFSTSIVFANQQTLSNIPFGTYQLTATGTVNGQPVSITVTPSQVTLNSSTSTLPVTLNYKSTAASLTVSLPIAQPNDISTTNVTVNLTNASGVTQPINVPWKSSATVSGLIAGTSYTLSANAINGQSNQYQFTFSPSSFIAQAGQNNATMGVISKPLPTGTANVTVTGLPATIATSLMFTHTVGSTPQTITFNNVLNGLHSYVLPAGYQYNLTSQAVTANGLRYSSTPVNLTIQANTTTSINLPFTAASSHYVSGWPNYLAMGAVTDDSPTNATSLQTRPIDAIFKYGGFGGNGDTGQIIYPIFDMETADQAKTITAYYQQHGITNIVKPVMVIYTAFMSNGVNFGDFDYTNLVMHYITLMMEAQKLQSYKTVQNPYPGTIILNPDLFGLVQQQDLLAQLSITISGISLQNALKTAVCFITSTITTSYGANLNYEQLYEAIRGQTTDNWTAMSTWDGFKMQYFDNCTANPVIPGNIIIPAFTNDFPGWVQSTNWIIRQFAPNITFGWQENLWATGTSNWVHQNYTASQLQSQISTPTVTGLNATTAYSGNYIPDFLVFDKYEMDAIPNATASGYLFNARDWTNILAHAKNVSESLGTIPIMLW